MQNNRMMRAVRLMATLAALSGALSACTSMGAKPWDRDLLARRAMAPVTHPNVTGFDEHIYFSKEGSSGGSGSAGGGCGCN